MKANLKALEDSKTALAKIKTKEEPQVAKAKKWSEAEVETTKKPDAIHRESKNFTSYEANWTIDQPFSEFR